MSEKTDRASAWYTEQRSLYEDFCERIKAICTDIIDTEKVPYQSITCRAKTIESFTEKCEDEKYSNPETEITDLAGVRIIVYLDSDVGKICDIVEREFTIDKINSLDKSKELKHNQIGYRSVHYIISLDSRRASISENRRFAELKCEVQIRTLLQHAWAEIEHDRGYKFKGELPIDIKRPFFLIAGMLEIADIEFERLCKMIDKYAKETLSKTSRGELDLPVNSTSLVQYMNHRFSYIENKNFPIDSLQLVVQELNDYGIVEISQIDKIIDKRFEDWVKETKINYTGALRRLMIIRNPDLYFEKAWNRHWTSVDPSAIQEYNIIGFNIKECIDKYGVKISRKRE